MLDYRTLYKMMRKYYDPRNSTSRLFYTHTTGKPAPGGTPGSRTIKGMSTVYGNASLVRYHFGHVTDNKDPDGWGRIKVQFPQYGDDFESDWAPIVRPFAGADRGIFTLPEIDETVICAFLGDKPTRPLVLGSVYTPQQPNPFGENPDNDLKVLMTKTNMRLEMLDKEGEETITLYMKDGQMRVVMKKDQGMEIVNELGDINVKCRKLILEAGDNAALLFEKDFTINADEISLESAKGIAGKAGGNVKLKGQAIALEGNAGVTAENKQIAAKDDMVVGVDIHIEMVPSGNGTAPAPIPNPYIGKLVDELSSDVKVKGNYAAVKGSKSKGNGPGHILLPPGVKWQKDPSNEGVVFTGTIPSVKINNKEAAVLGSTVKTCADPTDAPNCQIVAIGAPITIPVMVPGMDPLQFQRDGGTVVNTREPVANQAASNESAAQLKNPKWEKDKGTIAEDIKLMVDLQEQYEGANVYFTVYREPPEGEKARLDTTMQPLTTIAGLQARLNYLGFGCGKVDNRHGMVTTAGIKRFQEKQGLDVTGKADDATRDALSQEWDRVEEEWQGSEDFVEAPLAKVTGVNSGGHAEVTWKYKYVHDPKNPLTEKPKLYFTVDSFRCEQVKSDPIEFGQKAKVTIVSNAETEEEMLPFTGELVVVGADGEKQNVTPDDNGVIEIEDLIPGEFTLMIESEDNEGGN